MKFSPFFHVLCTISINISISMEIFFMIIINNVSILEYWIFYTLTFYLYPVIIFKKTRMILYWNSKYFINKKIAPYVYPIKKKLISTIQTYHWMKVYENFDHLQCTQFREFEK